MIELKVKVEKNINELKKKQLKAIVWSTLPLEQYDYIDAETYKKLDAYGRRKVNEQVYLYDTKPVEYWCVVFSHKPESTFVENLLNCNKPAELYKNHPEFIKKYVTLDTQLNYGLCSIKEYVEHYTYNSLSSTWSYNSFANPNIPVASFLEKVTIDGTDYIAMDYLSKEIFSSCQQDNFSFILPNSVLTTFGFEAIPDITAEFLESNDACYNGAEIARRWIDKLGTDGILRWDDVVTFLHEKPEFYDEDAESCLEWLWEIIQ